MASKSKTTATRSSSRNKLAAEAVAAPAPTRTTRSGTATKGASTQPKKTVSRKPLLNRANSPESENVSGGKEAGSTTKAARSTALTISQASDLSNLDDDREPIQAFLRIRPHSGDEEPSGQPYLEPISDTAVRMTDPLTSHTRLSTVNPSSIYTFSHIFPPDTNQSDFFRKTTLPLVKGILDGQSGLLFTYGVTNSGKTYTIQGGSKEGSAGILPRTLDVIFNSIDGLQGDGRYRPIRLNGVELANEPSSSATHKSSKRINAPALSDVLDEPQDNDTDIDQTTLKLDRNHEYTIWLSYSEVYNEKVYDLFSDIDSQGPSLQSNASRMPHPTSTFMSVPLPSSQSQPILLTRKALQVKPCPPSDSGLSAAEANQAGKYVAGLRQIQVRSAAEAKELLRLGQLHRRVFGTLANSQSSRSHALVTIKVLRVHRGERNDPSSIQTSRLTLVDLAGSERTKHTQTSGDRLREAGNINKSLMVLGQCMETLRANQATVARSLGTTSGRIDTRDVKRGLAVVPFRHSKLTEILMDYFVGEGRAVMIVNVNPYDTGFDENSHVMRFASLAREVCTVPASATVHTLPAAQSNRGSEVVPHRRKVTISSGVPGRKFSQAHLEVLEEDEEPNESGEDDGAEPINPLVDALFDEIERLRGQLYEAEMRCALIEADTREEVMEEMEERMRGMEQAFKRRLVKEKEDNERKMDAKIDMINLSRQQLATSDNVESSVDEYDDASVRTRSPSPLASKGKDKGGKRQSNLRPASRGTVSTLPLHKRTMSYDGEGEGDSALSSDSESDDHHDADSDEQLSRKAKPYTPPRETSSGKARRQPFLTEAPSPIFEADVIAGKVMPKGKNPLDQLAQLGAEMEELSLQDDLDDSAVILEKKLRQTGAETDAGKKKKRQLGKNRIMTDDDMAAIILGTAQDAGKAQGVRRSGRH